MCKEMPWNNVYALFPAYNKKSLFEAQHYPQYIFQE